MWATIAKFLPDFLLKLLGVSEQIAENKGEKIPMQEPAIREKAETRAEKENIKQHRLKQVIPKEQIEAEVQTLGLKKRHERRLTNILHDLITSGATINTIAWHDEKIIYCYTDKHNVGKSGEY